MNIILAIALSVLLGSCTRLPPKQGIPTNSVDHTPPSAMAMGSAWMTERVGVQQVQYRIFQSTAAGAVVSYHVYVPATYDRQPNARFPVLYWLHGTGGGVRGIAPISRYFDDAIRAGKIAPMLVVFANGLPEGMWCDSADGKTPVETVFIHELIPHVDANFRTRAQREGRLLEGFSMGGYGAARLGLRYHDLFAAVSMLAAGPLDPDFMGPRATSNPAERSRILRNVYAGSAAGDLGNFRAQSPWVIAEQLSERARASVKLRVMIGDGDFTLEANRQFSVHLRRLGFSHEYIELSGVAHDTMAILNAVGESNWRFYRDVLPQN